MIIKIRNYESNDDYIGYEIETDNQYIRFLIDEDQQCCEDWGILESHENFDDFIDANIININRVDNSSSDWIKKDIECFNKEEDFDRYYALSFLNIETDKGTINFAAYNGHNGYYGHIVKIQTESKKDKKIVELEEVI